MSYEVVLIGIDENFNEKEEVYTRCESEDDAMRAALLLRKSMFAFVIQIRETPAQDAFGAVTGVLRQSRSASAHEH